MHTRQFHPTVPEGIRGKRSGVSFARTDFSRRNEVPRHAHGEWIGAGGRPNIWIHGAVVSGPNGCWGVAFQLQRLAKAIIQLEAQ